MLRPTATITTTFEIVDEKTRVAAGANAPAA